MISALHLIWIIPISMMAGAIIMALADTAKGADKQSEKMFMEWREKNEV